ncbi:hypothetical protein K443DRAFT_680555 [Laccaria amethystina LaAM-08-1]|uniref:Uncharacterized protein n=1 Tax=Laccaria amethystina LaAM-08-1 TaxID=1095629 RepID=A0A0C9XMF7_9AGAR|nr:hypothetical protein K443DRAFT_680555 [Laccaria amethystina LaAM-08-1]
MSLTSIPAFRRPFPSFAQALACLPKQNLLDTHGNPQQEVLSEYYTSLFAPRDLMRTIRPKYGDDLLLPDVFLEDDESSETETEFDDSDERSSIHTPRERKRLLALFERAISRLLGTFRRNPASS